MAKRIPIIERKLTPVEKSWLACAIDSEGSIHLNGKKKPYPRIDIINTNVDYLNYVCKIVGLPKGQYTKMVTTWSQVYRVRINGTHAQQILKQIFSYLIIKQDKAAVALSIKVLTRKESALKASIISSQKRRLK